MPYIYGTNMLNISYIRRIWVVVSICFNVKFHHASQFLYTPKNTKPFEAAAIAAARALLELVPFKDPSGENSVGWTWQTLVVASMLMLPVNEGVLESKLMQIYGKFEEESP